MKAARFAFFLCFAALLATGQGKRSYADITGSARKIDGFLPLYWEEAAGRMWIDIDQFGKELLYVTSLPAGMGSNDVGLDRGQLGTTALVRFERVGPRVLLTALNTDFRAISNNPDERKAVEDSFAQSVLMGFDVAAESNGHVLIDGSALFLRDAHNAAGALQRARQGTYRMEASRSAFYMPRTKGFPKNTEVEVTITLVGEPAGAYVREVVPVPSAITLRQHHSFIQLPELAGFTPRVFDPRAGYFDFAYRDYATPVQERIEKKFIPRHRLHPGGQIVYYVDRGAPEPIRTALVEGARWWSQAFAAAGFPDGFKVEVLPEGADPMDVRYNVINWVHRSTRGWSYGASITDPRTGEILKGHVTLGSLRVRQDYMIAEGVLAPYEDGRQVPPKMMEMGLARLRQLSAHEVGHTLGLAHAYAASTQGRSSVMDYPHPQIDLGADAVPGLANAYATGIGEWDKVAINFGYRAFPAGTNEKAELNKIIADAYQKGLVFLTDQDARPLGSLHPKAHLWDSGANPVEELARLMKVRERVLARFDQRVIREGEPMSSLANALVPAYLLHRYQLEAAAKVLGGADYTFALRGDGQKVFEVVPGAQQKQALAVLLATLKPEALEFSPKLLSLLPPQANQYPRTRENFAGRTGLAFDPLGAAEALANHIAGLILQPERAARLVQYGAQNAQNPGLGDVVDALVDATWKAPAAKGMQAEIQRTVDAVVLYHLMALAAHDSVPAQVRAIARHRLHRLAEWMKPMSSTAGGGWAEFYFYAQDRIQRFENNPKEVTIPKPAEPPPGQPIGCEEWNPALPLGGRGVPVP